MLPAKIDAVVHLAQSENYRDFPESSIDIFRVNTFSTLKLLDYARKAKANVFLYTSSGGVKYLKKSKDLINFYLTSKLSSELLISNYKDFFNTIIIRPFFVYGYGSKEILLISRLINLLKRGKEIVLEGEEGIKINPIYVEDAVEAIIKAIILKGNHTIDVAGDEILSLREIVNIIAAQLSTVPNFKIVRGKNNQLIGDNSQMKKLLCKPKFCFKDGIKALLKKL